MKILMLTPYLPYPPSEGGQVRSYKLIKLLSKKHEITLVCFSRQHNTKNQINHMRKFCRKVLVIERGKTWTLSNILRTGFSVYPFLVSIYYSPKIKQILQSELDNGHYDLIHAEMSYTLPYLPKHNLPVILVEQTIMSRIFGHQAKTDKRLWFRPFMWIDIMKMRYWEKYFWKKVNRVVTVSEEDAKVVRSIMPGLRVDVVPNGVGEDVSNLPRTLHYNMEILYMGNYKWIQNWEAAELLAKKVYPLIKEQISSVRLVIAGQAPTKDVLALQSNKLDIKILGLAEDDFKGVVDAYLNAGLFVAPMYAPGGTRLKILAAMASMVPVVTTSIGAEGYGAVNGESILIGNTSKELADIAVKVLKDKNLYKKIAYNARDLVDKKFSWEPIAEKLEKIYEEIVHHNS
ncbi:MAG TPA: glycosyltransferase family 4 protein [Patescibacteria group bacterium]|nr:glycosyltransferase family 4 protein [Patescibacteria group bacterium]